MDHELDSEPFDQAAQDHLWLNSDLSQLGSHEPYQWQDGERDEGEPLPDLTHGRWDSACPVYAKDAPDSGLAQ